jgi:hypothetical protein
MEVVTGDIVSMAPADAVAVGFPPDTDARRLARCQPMSLAVSTSFRRERREQPRIGLRQRFGVERAFRGSQILRDKPFGKGDSRPYTINNRYTESRRQGRGKIRHPRTAEHNSIRMILVERPLYLRFDLSPRVGGRVIQFQNRNVGGSYLGAAPVKAVTQQVALDHRNGPRQRRHDAETNGDQARRVEGRLADSDDRLGRQRTGRIEAGIVKAGDNVRVCACRFTLGNPLQQSGHGISIVIDTLDRCRAKSGGLGADPRARTRNGSGGFRDRLRHRSGGVGIDNVEKHGPVRKLRIVTIVHLPDVAVTGDDVAICE